MVKLSSNQRLRKYFDFKQLLKKCPEYIYWSDEHANQALFRKIKKINQNNNFKNIINSRLNKINSFSVNGQKIDFTFDENNVLVEFWDSLAKGMNKAVEQNQIQQQLQLQMSQIVNNKQWLAQQSASTKYAKKGKQENKIKTILDYIVDLFSIVKKIPKTDILIYLSSKIQKHTIKKSRILLELERYIQQEIQKLNGTLISLPLSLKSSSEIDELFEILSKIGQSNSKQILNSMAGMYTDYFHKQFGEPIVSIISQDILNLLYNSSIEVFNTGAQTRTVNNNNNVSLKSDNISEYLNLNGQFKSEKIGDILNYQFSGHISFNDKWYKSTSATSTDIDTVRYWYDKDKKKHSKNVFLSTVSKSPVINYITKLTENEIKPELKRVYINAYFHPENGANYIDDIEKLVFLTSLMGDGSPVILPNGQQSFDVSLFFVVNGKYYSILKILNNILKQSNWRNHVSITYNPGKGNVLNKNQSSYIQNNGKKSLLLGIDRSQKALNWFIKEFKISAGIKASTLLNFLDK